MIGARMAPTFEPALTTPIASARSFLGNHSARVLVAAGKAGDSVTPRSALGAAEPKAERTVAWSMGAGAGGTKVDGVVRRTTAYDACWHSLMVGCQRYRPDDPPPGGVTVYSSPP